MSLIEELEYTTHKFLMKVYYRYVYDIVDHLYRVKLPYNYTNKVISCCIGIGRFIIVAKGMLNSVRRVSQCQKCVDDIVHN